MIPTRFRLCSMTNLGMCRPNPGVFPLGLEVSHATGAPSASFAPDDFYLHEVVETMSARSNCSKQHSARNLQQGSLHYTPEHCLVNGGFPSFLLERSHDSNGQNVSFKEPYSSRQQNIIPKCSRWLARQRSEEPNLRYRSVTCSGRMSSSTRVARFVTIKCASHQASLASRQATATF